MIVDSQTVRPPLFGPLLSRSTGLIVSKASDLFDAIFESALRPYGLRTKDFIVLAAINSMGPQSQQRLAHRLGIDRTTMVSVVDGLERLGLVDRARDPEDRRKYAIGLTGEGQSLLHDELAPTMLQSLDVFLAPLSIEERALFHKFLWRIVYERDQMETGEVAHELENGSSQPRHENKGAAAVNEA